MQDEDDDNYEEDEELMREEDAPHFGQTAANNNPIRDEINESLNQILGTSAVKTAAAPLDELDSAMMMPVEQK